MLKLNKEIKTNDLEKQFGIEFNEDAPQKWSDVQDKLNKEIRKQIDEHTKAGTEDPDFDATDALAIFFAAFNTQKLQDSALLQFIIRDIQERVKHIANSPKRDELERLLLQKLEQKLDNDDFTEIDDVPPFL